MRPLTRFTNSSDLKSIYYDLHIHSCLSPCGDADMTPANIAGMAAVKGLDVIALTDHNSCRNCGAAMRAAENYGVVCIPGMELTTAEEAHAVCLFRTLEAALDFDAYVYDRLQKIPNKEKFFGEQLLMDEEDTVLGKEPNLLINATDIPFDEVWALAKRFDGVMFPAHLDKTTTSLISSLGFIPPESEFTTAEIKDLKNLHELRAEHPYLEHCRIISNSDAHLLEDIREPELTLEVGECSIDAVIDLLGQRFVQ